MKQFVMLSVALSFLFAACGGGDDVEALKKENAELKAKLEKCEKQMKLLDRGRGAFDMRSRMRGDRRDVTEEGAAYDSGEEPVGHSSKHVSWYPNGQVMEEVEVNDNDDYHGTFVSFYENGQKKEEGQYRDNKKHGRWIKYDEKGNITEEVVYDKGVKQEE